VSTAWSREEAARELVAILPKYVGKFAPSEDPWLYHYLGLLSDDASELFDEIHVRFGTCFDCLEDWHSYFPADMETIGEKTSVRLGFAPIPVKPLPLSHLVEVIVLGAWFDPPPKRDLRS
jgi:hypothetical protein